MMLSRLSAGQTPGPQVERIRHEAQPCELQVESVRYLTPGMLRVTLYGEALAGFQSLAFDDHMKIFVPGTGGDIVKRHYTPRYIDRQAGRLVIDFAVHDAGPATRWALQVRPGDTLSVRGPKSSKVIDGHVRRWLLIGDETALPAIGRCIEESDPGTEITGVVAVASAYEHQHFDTPANLVTHWAHRPLSAGSDPRVLLDILRTIEIAPDTLVWLAAEATVVRALRTYLLEERDCPQKWLKAGGYWVAGKANGHERFG